MAHRPRLKHLLTAILRAENIEYAIFDRDGFLKSTSPGLEKKLARKIRPNSSLESVFPELTGMFPDLQQTVLRGEELRISHIARPDWNDGNGYMSLHFLWHEGDILALVKDTSTIANLEQRIVQQRNELALINAKLERMQTHLLDITSRFMPGQVLESFLKTPTPPTIGGECREVTILFADLRGFTLWAQEQTAETVFDTLNSLLADAVRVVLRWDGTLDKFMGDGLMVIFNAPHEQPDHIERAAQCALELSRLVLPGTNLCFGIGIHSGKAVVGNVGAAQAMNYTALGSTVNIAKRIEESANGGEVLISETIARYLSPSFDVSYHHDLLLGKPPRAIPIYQLKPNKQGGEYVQEK